MPRTLHKLSARRVATETKQGRFADGGGLYLQVGPNGNKAWLFRFQIDGKPRQMGLGAVHTVSLADARIEAEACRRLVRDGLDPIETRKAEKLERRQEALPVKTFKECAKGYIKGHAGKWSNAKHSAQWEATLATYAYPHIGALSIDVIDTPHVLEVLEPIWTDKAETASRVRQRIEAIIDWATARKYRSGENPARWKGHLNKVLPARPKRSKKHHAALPYKEINAFIAALHGHEGIASRGLEFLILTASRTGEVIGAKWDEIDEAENCWTVPADRMKAGVAHRVPLSDQAVEIIKEMKKVRQSEYIFPGTRPKAPLSNMAFLAILKRMKRQDITVHGFRSTFRDWAAEQTNYPREVAEAALAHTIPDAVEAAYRRGDLFAKRRRLMTSWANYVDASPVSENVVHIGER
ncbi:MAG: tyrosine-type recombinase/integrase [Alphaproteobacteria bacterium]|nr:tyrosine-type recombinase/integrase [Alphaproteobacteria bacterium]